MTFIKVTHLLTPDFMEFFEIDRFADSDSLFWACGSWLELVDAAVVGILVEVGGLGAGRFLGLDTCSVGA